MGISCIARSETAGWHLLVAVLVVAFAIVTTGGFSGCSCRDDAEIAKAEKEKKEKEEKLKKEKPKPKPDFERLNLNVQPAKAQGEIRIRPVKPGHWTSAIVDGQANNFDFPGDLRSEVVDRTGNRIGIDRTTYHLVTSRPAVLAKGQKKQLEFSFLVPQGDTKTWLQTGLVDRRGSEIKRDTELLSHMPSYEYYLLVLSRHPENYKYLTKLDSVKPPFGELEDVPDLFYRVVRPTLAGRIPLPIQPLCWTSLAYIIWDDVEPSLLVPEQQQAMLDWLEWGGQLVISGPETLDVLASSFLAPLLPAKWVSTRKLDADALAELNEKWTVAGMKSKSLNVVKPWSGIGLEKDPQAAFLPGTGELMVERRVGRGRIVVSAFRLTQAELRAWPSVDSFFNACVLRRPPRDFKAPNGILHFDWVGDVGNRWDPRLVTSLRYFSRDARGKKKADEAAERPVVDPNEGASFRYSWRRNGAEDSTRRIEATRECGAAGWNDFSDVSNTSRRSLKNAAGIVIPSRQFVARILGVYLLVLVPINWTLFRLLRRIEFAWIAAPVIAVVGAIAVVRLAQLDIGFARAQTELAVLELYGGYPRAHLTRYTALYSSLSSSYNVTFDDPSAVALPLSNDFLLISGQRLSDVNYRRDQDVRLTDIDIRSNSTAMLHSEQIYDLGGSLSVSSGADGKWTLRNGTKLPLAGVGVLRLNAGHSHDAAWVGALAPGQEVHLQFETAHWPLWDVNRQEALALSRAHDNSALNLDQLLALAEEPRDMKPGEIRLVGWLQGDLGGLHVQPVAPQIRQSTLVVANLRPGDYDAPKPDPRLRIDVMEFTTNDLDDKAEEGQGTESTLPGGPE